MSQRVPPFPLEMRARLCVQTCGRECNWSEPRPATLEDLIAAVRELSPEAQANVASGIGIVPKDAAERLQAAEHVLDALSDAQMAIDRFRKYRLTYPEKRDPDLEF